MHETWDCTPGTGASASRARAARDGRRKPTGSGYESIWAAEAYGSDAATVLAWLASNTERANLASGIFQMPARTPAMTAMTAATLDNISGGRVQARPRHLRPAGGRGLARSAVRRAAGAHARVRRHRAHGARPRDGHLPGRVLRAAAARRPGQAAEDDHRPRAGADPDLHRRDRAEEHALTGRDRRRLASDDLRARALRHLPALARGGRRARRALARRTSTSRR